MDSTKRSARVAFGTVMVLVLLALLTGVYWLAAPPNDAPRALVFVLPGLVVIVLLVREIAEHERTEKAAHTAQSLNEQLDQREAQRTRELAQANRELETEMANHRRSTEQLRLLTAHLQSAREEERVRIAQEIHDELGTLMTAIKMDLAFLSKEIAGQGEGNHPSGCAKRLATRPNWWTLPSGQFTRSCLNCALRYWTIWACGRRLNGNFRSSRRAPKISANLLPAWNRFNGIPGVRRPFSGSFRRR